MRPYPHFPARRSHDLERTWDFAFLGDVDLDHVDLAAIRWADKMPVPSCFDVFPDFAGVRGVGAYRVVVPATPGSRAVVRFGGGGLRLRVLVDGVPVGGCDLPYSGFTVEVPASPKPHRELVVLCDNRIEHQPLVRMWYDFYLYGGLYRGVWWDELPAAGPVIDRVRVATLDLARGRIRAEVRLAGAAATIDLRLRVDCGDERRFAGVPVRDGVATVELDLDDRRPWSPADPVLHRLTVACGDDAITERFGLRTVAVRGPDILLNGAPVKLLGYCRHESHAQFGPALPPAQMVQDLQLLRDLGCTFIRGSHYPQDQRFLDLCDEMGFLVWEEALGWGHDEKQWAAPAFAELNAAQTAAMVANSYNHPSVILWGFLNEGGSHKPANRPLYERLFAIIRGLDRTRPVTYASNRVFDGGQECLLDLADVIALNTYPGWYANDKETPRPLHEILPALRAQHAVALKIAGGPKPFIISEIGAAALYGWRDALHGHYSEEYQAEYLALVCREVVDNPAIAGVALWQFCDGRTYPTAYALGRPRTFNNKGTFDEYRRPKQAAAEVRRIFRGGR